MPQNPLDDVDWDAVKRYKKLVLIVPLFLLIAVGALTSYYIVQPEEEAVVKRFGLVVAQKEPGLHFKLPSASTLRKWYRPLACLNKSLAFALKASMGARATAKTGCIAMNRLC
jgi:hypothetical protein